MNKELLLEFKTKKLPRSKRVALPGALGNRDVVLVKVSKVGETIKIFKPNGSVDVVGKKGIIPEFRPSKKRVTVPQKR